MNVDRYGVYRVFDADDNLLYVGSSNNISHRLRTHQMKTWGDQISGIKIEWHKSKEAAQAAEMAAIRDEAPRYNIEHSRSGTRTASGTRYNQVIKALMERGPSTQVELEHHFIAADLGRSFVGQTLLRLWDKGYVTVVDERPGNGRWKSVRVYGLVDAA